MSFSAYSHSLRAALLSSIAALTAMSAGPAAAQSTGAQEIQLPSQSLSEALVAIGQLYDVTIIAPNGLTAGRAAPAISGAMTVDEVVAEALAGSGLAVREGPGGSLVLTEVRAAAPASIVSDQIVVLATKSGVPLSKTPQAVSVIDRTQIEQLNAQTVEEVLRYTPGVQSEFGGRRNTDFVIIRGFSQIEFAFRDGLRLSSIDFPTAQEVWGLESIDILKGPASVLYGQIAPGGLINFQSKLPTGESIADVQFSAGTYGQVSAAVDVGGNLDQAGEWQFRAPVAYRRSEDPVDFVERRRFFASPSLTWRPSDAMDFTVFSLFQDDRYDTPVSLPVSGSIEPNPNGDIPLFAFLGEPDLEQNEERQYRIGYIFNYRMSSDLKFRQIARYHRTDVLSNSLFVSGFQADGRTLNRFFGGSDLVTKAFAIDNQLEGVFETGNLNHRVLVGVDYFNEVYDDTFASADIAPIDAFAPVYGASLTNFDAAAFNFKEKADQIHPYLQYRLTVADRFVAVGGVGYGWTRANGFFDGVEVSDETVDAVVGNAALMYTAYNGLSIYASYAQSFRPQLGVSPLEDGSRPDPSEGDQYEIGVKWDPAGGPLSATLAVYDLTLSDLLRFVQPSSGPGFNVVDGDSKHRGVDFDFSADITDVLNLRGGYSYIDATIEGSITGRNGLRPTNVPKHSASVFATLDGSVAGLPGSSLSLGGRYFGDRRGQGVTDLLPSAFIVDLAARYELGRYEIGVNVNNLFDERYIAGARASGVNPGDPLTATFVLSASF